MELTDPFLVIEIGHEHTRPHYVRSGSAKILYRAHNQYQTALRLSGCIAHSRRAIVFYRSGT